VSIENTATRHVSQAIEPKKESFCCGSDGEDHVEMGGDTLKNRSRFGQRLRLHRSDFPVTSRRYTEDHAAATGGRSEAPDKLTFSTCFNKML